MKNNIDQPPTRPASGVGAYGLNQGAAVGPPERQFGWLSSYNEEWELFIMEQSKRKTQGGFNHTDQDDRPRVWNCPRY